MAQVRKTTATPREQHVKHTLLYVAESRGKSTSYPFNYSPRPRYREYRVSLEPTFSAHSTSIVKGKCSRTRTPRIVDFATCLKTRHFSPAISLARYPSRCVYLPARSVFLSSGATADHPFRSRGNSLPRTRRPPGLVADPHRAKFTVTRDSAGDEPPRPRNARFARPRFDHLSVL